MGANISLQPPVSFIQSQEVQVAVVTFVISAVAFRVVRKLISNEKPTPPGPWGFPIVGHLPLLGKEANVTFMKMRERFGDVFQIRMGSWDTVVVNGKSAIKEALIKKDEDFAGRPMFESAKLISDGESLGFGKYDESYSAHRKLVARLLTEFASARTNPIENMVHEEVDILVQDFLSHSSESFDPLKALYMSVSSVIYQICYGHQENIRENKDFSFFITTNGEFAQFVSAGNPVDVLPWLQYIMPWKAQKFVHLISKGIHLRNKKVEEHRQNFLQVDLRDITDGLLAVLKKGTPLREERVLGSIDAIFGAGLETVASTLVWIVFLMAANPEIQKHVQKELDEVVGSGRRSCLQDRERLVFTEAVLHEVNRFTAISPLSLPHSAIRDTELCGYRIKKDTVVFTNLYSMSYDRNVWGDPDVFRPERFLDDSGQINKSLLDEFLPFSAGRRKCLGESLARSEIFLFFTGLLQRCSIVKPPEVKEYKMEIKFGLARQCMPYDIQVKPRI